MTERLRLSKLQNEKKRSENDDFWNTGRVGNTAKMITSFIQASRTSDSKSAESTSEQTAAVTKLAAESKSRMYEIGWNAAKKRVVVPGYRLPISRQFLISPEVRILPLER